MAGAWCLQEEPTLTWARRVRDVRGGGGSRGRRVEWGVAVQGGVYDERRPRRVGVQVCRGV